MTRYSAYMICGTPRSGSTLLCEMLAATGAAGRPHSYFREPDIAYWARQWGMDVPGDIETVEFDRAYLATMLRTGRGGTDIFGLRVMWSSLGDASRRLDRALGGSADIATRFEQAFGPTLFVHLTRGDKLGQAISLLRAEQSGLWHLAADGSVLEGGEQVQRVHYDAARIGDLIAELEADDASWETFFAVRGIAPLRLTYAGVSADPAGTLASVLASLGLDPALADSVAVPTRKMADATSCEWAERYAAAS